MLKKPEPVRDELLIPDPKQRRDLLATSFSDPHLFKICTCTRTRTPLLVDRTTHCCPILRVHHMSPARSSNKIHSPQLTTCRLRLSNTDVFENRDDRVRRRSVISLLKDSDHCLGNLIILSIVHHLDNIIQRNSTATNSCSTITCHIYRRTINARSRISPTCIQTYATLPTSHNNGYDRDANILQEARELNVNTHL